MTYFFIHTPKTSGTTFTKVLEADKTKKTAFFYPAQKDFNQFEKRIKEGPQIHLVQNPDWEENDFVVGHFTYGIHKTFEASKFKYLGVYRDPTAHYLSMFKHFNRMNEEFQKNILPEEISLKEMLKLDYTHNMQTFFISGMSVSEIRRDKEKAFSKCVENIEKHFVGLYPTDRFIEGLFYFKEKIGLKPLMRKRENVSKNSIDVGRDIKEKILDVNDVDLRLYNYLEDRFNREFEQMNLKGEMTWFKIKNWFKKQ